METFQQVFKKIIVLAAIFLCLQVAAYSQTRVPDTSYMKEIDPNTGLVSIEQVTFFFDSGRLVDSDWGQIKVDPNKWNEATGLRSGYLNFFLNDSSSLNRRWVIQNMYIPSAIVDFCPPIVDEPNSPNEPGSTNPGSTPPDPDPTEPPLPLSMYFDLRPGTDGSGGLDILIGNLIVSKQPLPVVDDILNAINTFPIRTLQVDSTLINAEGHTKTIIIPQSTTIESFTPDFVGFPPVPPGPDPLPNFPLDLAFPIEVFQSEFPNVQCAKNQCVPMAHANVLGYLRDRYDGVPFVWHLPHAAIPGIGQVFGAGDVIYWAPVPEASLVANVDTFTRRDGVLNAGVGDTSSECQMIQGPFGYIAEFGNYAKTIFRHQGGQPSYGDGTFCDTSTFSLGGLVSNREGVYPTWQWIYEQLILGRGVSIVFGRYDNGGNRTSGHMVRVWGAARYLEKDYIYTLDDEYQGMNNYGLRTQQWEVKDTGQPGLPGVPDGQLNLGDTTWEIEFAISAQAKTTLAIP